MTVPQMPPHPQIGLVLHPQRDPGEVAGTIVGWARSHGAEVLVREDDAGRVPDGARGVPEAEIAASADALIALGGDGTMLGALRLAAARPVPVLGVNLGHLGFLVEVEPRELSGALDRLEMGDFEVEDHPAVILSAAGEEFVGFNDVALARVPGDGAVQAALTVAGRAYGRYRCDALILATPIGSTAYSYAAGGPVVSPMLDAVIVSPAAPMAGISRPMVMAAGEPIGLELLPESGRPALEVDGTVLRRAEPGESIGVRLRPNAGRVVRLDVDRFQRRNQVKLSLLDLPFLPEDVRDLAPGSPPPLDST
jgi:NAD+ kinase